MLGALLLALGLPAPSAWASVPRQGSLDRSFGVGGVVTTSFGVDYATARAEAIDTDGNIVAVGGTADFTNGTFAVARYDLTGHLDTTFDTDGTVTTAIGTNSYATGVGFEPDGKVVVSGYTSNGFGDVAVARYDTDGSLDPAWATGGIATEPIGDHAEYASSLAVQADGKVLVTGSTDTAAGRDLFTLRFNTDGTLDPTWSSDGIVTTSIGAWTLGGGIALDPSGDVVVTGSTRGADSTLNFTVLRYTAGGILDDQFGSGGIVTKSLSSGDDRANAVTTDPSGRVVVVGSASDKLAVVRLLDDGTLDSSFGSEGKVLTPVGTEPATGRSVAVTPAGKIVVAGDDSGTGSIVDDPFLLVRYRVDGSLDPTFGTGGVVLTKTDGEGAFAVRLDAERRIVVAGSAGGSFAVARYLTEIYRPDALVERTGDAAYLGDGIYNLTGRNQTRSVKVARSKMVTFSFKLQNDGNAAERLCAKGPHGTTGFHLTYLAGTTVVTPDLVGGTYCTKSLAAGRSALLSAKVKVAADARVGATLLVPLTVTSKHSPAADVARAKVTVA